MGIWRRLFFKPRKGVGVVGVVGLGYVGLPLATLFAKKGYKVIGYDVNEPKVAELKRGIDSTKQVEKVHPGVLFTTDPAELRSCRMIFVCVPTSLRQRRIDTRAIKAATRTIAENLSPDTIVVYESSVYTGLTRELLQILLQLSNHGKFRVGYSPERVNPGDKVHTTARITKLVAGDTPATAYDIAAFYRDVLDADVHVCPSLEVAESAKLFENIQRASLIALANELAIYCHDRGMNTQDVLDACKTKWNFVPMQPGLVAGDCLPVNPTYFMHKNAERGCHPLELVESISKHNHYFPGYILEEVWKACPSPIGKLAILGVAYKENIGDVRMTGALPLYKGLHAKETFFVDPHATSFSFKLSKLEDILDGSLDVVILTVAHREFKEWRFQRELFKKMKPGGWIFDLKGVIPYVPGGSINLWRL